MQSEMIGSVKPYNRQIIISTGKSDWERDIADDKDSLAAALVEVIDKSPPLRSVPPSSSSVPEPSLALSPSKQVSPVLVPDLGLFHNLDSTRISVLNGSHRTLSHEDNRESVLVFPDYKVVTEVSRNFQGAQDLWTSALNPAVPKEVAAPVVAKGGAPLRSWILPYSCVILLCSHKRRDNRCGIAAPKLEHAFIRSLEAQGWDADTQLEHPSLSVGQALEEFKEQEERDENIVAQLKQSSESKRALIVKVSHIGGHKYAGNCIIYTPSGSGVWYGRVTPHDVDSVVTNTIINGLILPLLLRGGLNLSKPNCKSLNDW